MWTRLSNRVKDSLLLQLAAGAAAAFTLAAVVFTLLQWVMVNFFSERLLRESLIEQAIDVCENLRISPDDGVLRVELPPILKFGYDAYVENLQYRVLDASGAVLLSSAAQTGATTPRGRSEGNEQSLPVARYSNNGRSMVTATAPCPLGGRTLTIEASRSDAFAELAGEAIGPAVVEAGLAMGLVSLIVFVLTALFTMRRALAPVEAVAAQAQAITPLNLKARLPEATLPREVRPVLAAFNHVLDRVETGYAIQQQFLAAAAHELKTPLSLLRSQVELDQAQLPPALARQLLADIDDMARVVHQMLQLAEASETQNYRFAQVNLSLVLQDVIRYLQRLATGCNVHVLYKSEVSALMLPADRGAVFSLFKNLIENAILHSPAGETVLVELHEDRAKVSDHGEGIDASLHERVFERFWRGPGSQRRGGAGLGLSICKEVAQRHGWSIRIVSSPTAGAEFQVVFSDRAYRLPG